MSKERRRNQDSEPSPEFIQEMKRHFRQVYEMAKIYIEMYRVAEPHRYDPEMGRILVDNHSMPDGMPAALTQLIDPVLAEKERSDWENRTSDVMNASKTWVRVLEDGGVEIKHEYEQYDSNRKMPTVDIDDVPAALSAMTSREEYPEDEEDFDLIEDTVDHISRSGKTTLKRSEQVMVLRMVDGKGSAEMSEWAEEYDRDGNITSRTESPVKVYEAGSSEINSDIMTYRFNWFGEIRYLLNKGVESEAPEYWASKFSPEARRMIHRFTLSEIVTNTKEGKERGSRSDIEFTGHTEFRDGFMFPQLEFGKYVTYKDEDGMIIIESTNLRHDMDEGFIADELSIPAPAPSGSGMRTLFEYSDQVRDMVKEWKVARESEIGKDESEQEILDQIEELKTLLRESESGTLEGQIRLMRINPKDGTYSYTFVKRILKDGKPDLEIHDGNEPVNEPGLHELATLMNLMV